MIVFVLQTSQVSGSFLKDTTEVFQVAAKQEAKFAHKALPSFQFHSLLRVTIPKALSTLYNCLKLTGVSGHGLSIVLSRMSEH